MEVVRGEDFEVCWESGETGQTGSVALMLIDNDGATVWTFDTTDIVETPAGSGVYCANRTAPIVIGHYTLIFSIDGTLDPESISITDLYVGATADSFSPLPPSGGDPFSSICSVWTTAEDVALCCGASVGSDVDAFEDSVTQASELLFELSGRRFAGLCENTVRPRCDSCLCGYQVLSRGHIVVPPGHYGDLCGHCLVACSPSKVLLAGYPVREITEVKIDGDVVDDDLYTLWDKRYLVRLDDGRWPIRQNLTLADTEDSTFSVTYLHGQDPPLAGQAAAGELACEIYRSCRGDADCVLPNGITRIVRQNLTIERNAFSAWGRQEGIWRTGLSLVDVFLNAYNPAGIKRRPVMITPGRRFFPQNV